MLQFIGSQRAGHNLVTEQQEGRACSVLSGKLTFVRMRRKGRRDPRRFEYRHQPWRALGGHNQESLAGPVCWLLLGSHM